MSNLIQLITRGRELKKATSNVSSEQFLSLLPEIESWHVAIENETFDAKTNPKQLTELQDIMQQLLSEVESHQRELSDMLVKLRQEKKHSETYRTISSQDSSLEYKQVESKK